MKCLSFLFVGVIFSFASHASIEAADLRGSIQVTPAKTIVERGRAVNCQEPVLDNRVSFSNVRIQWKGEENLHLKEMRLVIDDDRPGQSAHTCLLTGNVLDMIFGIREGKIKSGDVVRSRKGCTLHCGGLNISLADPMAFDGIVEVRGETASGKGVRFRTPIQAEIY